MTLEELKAEIDELKESSKWHTMQIGILDATINGMQAQQPEQPKLERWKPGFDAQYYFIYDDADVADTSFLAVNDEDRWNFFNCFQTREEAQQEALRTRARRKLEWYARKLNTAAVGQKKYYLSEGFRFHIVEFVGDGNLPLGVVYFHSKADAEYALSQMTSEELGALR